MPDIPIDPQQLTLDIETVLARVRAAT